MTETSMPTAWLIFHLSVLASISNTAPASDLVINLPGLNFTPKFASYSGYLKASKKDMFHYWFTESQQNPSTDPLILWLNGGPGCSSLGGLMEELGPFKLKDYGTVVYSNECSWNLFANVLFLESPSGVGYSFNTDANFTTNDDDVAKHNYYALVDFLGKFPEYRGRDTYIMGESYAGVYLPTLGVKIISDPFNFPNFKGVAMGNGALNVAGNYDTIVPVYYYHGLIRDELYFNFSSTCCGSNIERCNIVAALSDPTCSTLLSEIFQATNDLDPYNIYSTCYSTSFVGKKAQIERFLRKAANLPTRNIRKTPFGIPLCDQIGNTEDYLNRADVRKALHIPVFLLKWSDCSTAVEGSYVTTHYDMLPEIEEINAAGVKCRHRVCTMLRSRMDEVGKILIYNGDVDTVCNHAMNSQFLSRLNRTILGKERVNEPWSYLGENPATAGFQVQYEGGIDFLTVRGSGHFVPADKPREALQMVYNFVTDQDYSLPVPF